jgi:hypothetical protein
VSQATIGLLICPILLGVSFWQRPGKDAYSARKVILVILGYIAVPLLFGSASIYTDTENFQVTVKDTKGNPVEHANAKYAIALWTCAEAGLDPDVGKGADMGHVFASRKDAFLRDDGARNE